MKNQDFTTTISVEKTPQEVFDAVKNVRGWWSENIVGRTDQLGSEFDYHYKDVHRCKMKIIELISEQKMAWLVTDNDFNFTKDKSEWINTKVIFEVMPQNGKTEIRFTHQGLVPQYECYPVCDEAWSHYIQDSLRSLIETGKGQPIPKDEEGSFETQQVEKWNLNNK